MAQLRERPLFTREFEAVEDFRPDPTSSYLYGVTSEPRSEFAVSLQRRCSDVRFVEIRESEPLTFETDFPEHERVVVRRSGQLEGFVRALGEGPIYLDITGLGHSTWAPLVKVCLALNRVVRVVYLEPDTYALTPGPQAGEIFDLSERIDGISPIPLFTTLADAPESAACFVPLLGFEGVRLSHMLNEVQPDARKIIPVIGVPGFRPQYPFEAFLGNAAPLEKYKVARNVRLARSNCPFSLFYVLEDVRERYPGHQIQVGLIGTKPHALGAILFAIAAGESVEIIYDHVKRKVGRTAGLARCLVYGISEFLPLSRRAA
jgi:hypothetical protein